MSVPPTADSKVLVSNLLGEDGPPPAGTKLGDYEVSIFGLDKATVLAKLFDNACSPTEMMVSATFRTMSREDAKKYIGNDGEFNIDYLLGRCIKAKTKGYVLYTYLYNREHGKNRAEDVIASFHKT